MLQILNNLISNAIAYSESHHIEVGVREIREDPFHLVLEFYVRDWGRGIDPGEKERIFDRFYRGEGGLESQRHGTGLGLSICRDLARAMGADLTLDDSNQTGSCFRLKGRFPVMSKTQVPDTETTLASLEGQKVLIVEDLEYNREAMVEFFELMGCSVESTSNGRAALQMLANDAFHLVMMDWDLPGLPGPEVAQRHREAYPEDPVRIFALTAYSDDQKKALSERSGMDGFIAKPLTAVRLAYALGMKSSVVRTPQKKKDRLDEGLLRKNIAKLIQECEQAMHELDFDQVRRTAHRLTTLALIQNNHELQRVCREIQNSAEEKDRDATVSLVGLLNSWLPH